MSTSEAMGPQVWIGVVGVTAEADREILDGSPGAYFNMLVWAASEDEFRSKATSACTDYGLRTCEFDDVEPFADRTAKVHVSQALRELADETREARGVRFGTFHLWDSDERQG